MLGELKVPLRTLGGFLRFVTLISLHVYRALVQPQTRIAPSVSLSTLLSLLSCVNKRVCVMSMLRPKVSGGVMDASLEQPQPVTSSPYVWFGHICFSCILSGVCILSEIVFNCPEVKKENRRLHISCILLGTEDSPGTLQRLRLC